MTSFKMVEYDSSPKLYIVLKLNIIIWGGGAKGAWGLRISDLVKNPNGTDI